MSSLELKPVEKEMEFLIDGVRVGSGVIFINDGAVNIEDAEDVFYSALRKNERSLIKEAEEEQKSQIVDSLTPEQEEKLRTEHAKNYHGTDDDMPDAFESWLEDLSAEEITKIV